MLHQSLTMIGDTVYSHAKPVTFLSLNPLAMHDHEMRHLAVLAAARFALQVPIHSWSVTPGNHGRMMPDATWRDGQNHCAVEVDTGGYSLAVLQAKAAHFSVAYNSQLWVCTTKNRARSIEGVLGIKVLTVNWR